MDRHDRSPTCVWWLPPEFVAEATGCEGIPLPESGYPISCPAFLDAALVGSARGSVCNPHVLHVNQACVSPPREIPCPAQ